MKHLGFLIFICSCTLCLGQKDSLTDLDLDPRVLMGDCAHGHICCYAGCHCCTELLRIQEYDTIIKTFDDGSQRMTLVELYRFAVSYGPSPIRYSFTKNGETKIYYSAFPKYRGYYGRGLERSEIQKENDDFENGYALVFDQDNHHLLIDEKGNELKMAYHSRTQFTADLFIVSIILHSERIYGLTDAEDNIVAGLKYYQIDQPKDGLIKVKTTRHGSFGFLNVKGEVVIPCQFSDAEDFQNGLTRVIHDGRWKLMNTKGDFLTEENYNYMGSISEDRIAVRKGEKLGFINLNGEVVVPIEYDWVYNFSNGLTAVQKGYKWGFIDKSGAIVIPIQYDQVRSFNNGVTAVSVGENSNSDVWTIIDKSGKKVTKKEYDEIYDFKEGFAKTFKNGQGYGIIDRKGNELIASKYSIDTYGTVDSWFSNGLLLIREIGGDRSYSLINERAKEVLDLSDYTYVLGSTNTNSKSDEDLFLIVVKNDQYGVINSSGKVIIPCKYERIHPLENNCFRVIKEGKQGLVNNEGKVILSFENEWITTPLVHGLFKVSNNYDEYYVNEKGDRIEEVFEPAGR